MVGLGDCFSGVLVLLGGCGLLPTNEVKTMTTVDPEYGRLRKMLVDFSSGRGGDDAILEPLERWLRSLTPEVRLEVVKECFRPGVRAFVEYRPGLSWLTDVIENLHALDAHEVARILKHPGFDEEYPPLGHFFGGIDCVISGAQRQARGGDPSVAFSNGILTFASGMSDAEWILQYPEEYEQTEVCRKLIDEWQEAGGGLDDPRRDEIVKLQRVQIETFHYAQTGEWCRQVIESIVRRIDEHEK